MVALAIKVLSLEFTVDVIEFAIGVATVVSVFVCVYVCVCLFPSTVEASPD